MTSAVDTAATVDDESTSNTLKRRRSSNTIQNDVDIEQTSCKRVRSSSPTKNSTTDNNYIQSMFSSLNNIVQAHRNLVREYVDLQMCDRPDLSLDEQRFIQAEEDLIEKVEKNLHDSNNPSSTSPTPLSSSRNGKRQRYQSISSLNQSFDRVKHETHILKRIEELKSDGKWTNQRLAKCLEPNKRKTHWDYLLDEMRWLAEDFALEKRWKQAMAKKISQAVLKYFHDKNQSENQQQRNELKGWRKQSQFICKEVMNFWKNITKLAEYKQSTRMQGLHKHELDTNLMVDGDEEYDEEDTIEQEEKNEQDEYSLNEIQELQLDQQESLNVILKRHYGIDQWSPLNKIKNSLLQQEEENSLSDSNISENFDEESMSNEPDENYSIETDQQINDLKIKLQSFQPTGCTRDTTSMKTLVPFLLKHPLREYQHVGLDWLVKFYENKFNCILADETGLGKTIQTIALLAHLACAKGVWGPHLIVVPTSLMLSWELELKQWCPGLKILNYYGSVKERQLKRRAWTKSNAFHVCITSYRLILQDAISFKRKKWKYLILDEAQNVKLFQSKCWQTLLNLSSQRRLILTNKPLGNSLIEFKSLVQFLMPNLISSHEGFRQLFSNPSTETNDSLIKRLDTIIRPFVLRRLKTNVDKQMPQEHEHIVMCNLSKRQRQLYNDFIQCKSTRAIIQQGNLVSVINILMQLRKICNHPDLFESRPIISPFVFQKYLIQYEIPKFIADIDFKNPYVVHNVEPNDTFLCYRIQLNLQLTKDMFMNTITRSAYQQRIQLTTSIIDRYRNSTIWNQTTNLQNHSKTQQSLLDDLNDDEFQSETIYEKNQDDLRSRYELLFQINSERCQYRPFYGRDLLSQIQLAMNPCQSFNRATFSGYTLCQRVDESLTTTRNYMSNTDALRTLIKTNQDIFDDCRDILKR
ncbi:unnamed protein product [Rotaria magnacalcarata]